MHVLFLFVLSFDESGHRTLPSAGARGYYASTEREQGTRPYACWWGIHGNAESYGASPVLCYIHQDAAEGCWLRLYLLQPVTLT